MAAVHQFCTFFVEGLPLCIEVERVQEVLRPQPMTVVPLSTPCVRGLINLRGQIVTAVDLRRRLELPELPDVGASMNIVVRSEGGAVALLVDEIGDVLELDDVVFERPPETLRGFTRDVLKGVFKLKDQLLLVLDADKVTSLPNSGRHQGLSS